MGHRAWLTPVNNEIDTAENGEFCYGVSYVVQITETGSPFKIGSVVIAWSGDGSSTLKELQSKQLIKTTWLLDNLLHDFAAWHEGIGPEAFGKLILKGEEIDWTLIKKK